MDEALDWKAQCKAVVKHLNSQSYLLRNLKPVLTVSQLIMIYYAQVESKLLYGLIFWGQSTYAEKVFLAQKKAVRSIEGVGKRVSCRNLFKKFKIQTLTGLFIIENCMFIFKNRDKFQRNCDVHNINTRQKNNLRTHYSRLDVTKNSVSRLGTKIYNHLPPTIKKEANLSKFKKLLSEFLLEKCVYSLDEFFE